MNQSALSTTTGFAIVLIAAFQLGEALAQSAALRTVALTGQQAPGTPVDMTFSSLGLPAINDRGQTAFWADSEVDDNNAQGIWSEGSGTLALVALSGAPAPGTPSGVVFSSFGFPLLNDAGQTAFAADLSGSGVGGAGGGIWSDAPGKLSLVAQGGGRAPGTTDGVTFTLFFSYVFNNAGQTAFRAFVDDININQGIWIESAGTLSPVVLDGSHPPGAPDGVTIDHI